MEINKPSKSKIIILGPSDVIRWDDVVDVVGYPIKISKAVELGLNYEPTLKLATQLKKDLQSELGLLVKFPITFLMEKLQYKVGGGDKLLEIVKP